MTTKPLSVDVTIKGVDGVDKVFTGEGSVELFSTVEDILEAIEVKSENGEESGLSEILKLINFGLEAKERTSIRQKTLAKNAGPENSINKAVTQVMKAREAMGKPINETEARKLVMSMMG